MIQDGLPLGINVPSAAREKYTMAQLDNAVSWAMHTSVQALEHALHQAANPDHDCVGDHTTYNEDDPEIQEYVEQLDQFDVTIFLAFEDSMRMLFNANRRLFQVAGFPLFANKEE